MAYYPQYCGHFVLLLNTFKTKLSKYFGYPCLFIYTIKVYKILFLVKFMITTFEEERKYGVQGNAGISLNIRYKKHAKETSPVLIEIEIYNN